MNKIMPWMALMLLLFATACKKENTFSSGSTATINVINGAIGIPSVMLKMNGKFNPGNTSSSSTLSKLNYASNAFYYGKSGPTNVQILNGMDSSNLASNTYNLKDGGLYTLLLAGQVPNIEPVFIEESNFPFVPLSKIPTDADSVINVRYINLCPDAQPLNIRLTGSTTNEVSGLAYKGYTPFKSYPAKVTNYAGTIGYSILNFEILENSTVLRTYSMFVFSTNRFMNVAVVITGKKTPGVGQPSLSVIAVNYFQ